MVQSGKASVKSLQPDTLRSTFDPLQTQDYQTGGNIVGVSDKIGLAPPHVLIRHDQRFGIRENCRSPVHQSADCQPR